MPKLAFSLFCIWGIMNLIIPQNSFSQNALDLDGVDDFVQTTFPGITGTNARTVEAWIKTSANANPNNGGVQQIITDWGVFSTGTRFTFCVLWNDAIRVELSGGGLSGNIAVNDGLWHHVAVTYSPTAAVPYRLYVDGVLDILGSIPVALNTSLGNMRIGQRVDGARLFDGTIDEVRVWNYARTQTEIMNDMNQELCGTPTGLVAYYRFNQGTAGGNNSGLTTLNDLSGNNYNGTLSNFALNGSSSNWVAGAALPAGSSNTNLTETACGSYTSPSGNYTWNTSGMYMDTLPAASGCDSIFTIDLTIQQNSFDTLTAQACDSYLSPSGKIWVLSGMYQDTLPNNAGCDSLIAVDLTLGNSTFNFITAQECDSFISPSGLFTWTTSGTYNDTIPNASSCDSILQIDLVIEPSTSDSFATTSCEPYVSPSGKFFWETSGVYFDTVLNINGCNNYLTVNLMVDPVDTTTTKVENTIFAQPGADFYQWLDCNTGAIIAGAIDSSFLPPETGSYAVIITKGSCIDTSGCRSVDYGSWISQIGFAQPIKMFPNPASNQVLIDLGAIYPEIKIEIWNLSGQKVMNLKEREREEITIPLKEMARGSYFLKVRSKGNEAVMKLVVI